MPRPPKKKTRVIAKARREGELKAEVEHEYKSVKFIADMLPFLPEKYKKNAVIWIKHIVEQHLAKIPKGIAIIGMTLIIKAIIHESDELLSRLAAIQKAPLPTKFMIAVAPIIGVPLALLTVKPEKDFIPEWSEWITSFTLAYIIVEHAGQLALGFGEIAGDMKGLVALLLG